MRRVALVVGLAGLLTLASYGLAGPVQGSLGSYYKLEPGSRLRFAGQFKGGERACVIVKGDHDPPADITITVFELKQDPITKEIVENPVARDNAGGDLCSVIWYPPRTTRYAVQVSSNGSVWNKIWVAVK
jgi:hypothetical protein